MKKGAKRPSGEHIDGMYEGLPYTGPPLNLKNDDPASMRPRRRAEVKVYIFTMDEEKDRDRYAELLNEVALGWAQISEEKSEWIPRLETWKVFLRLLHHKYIEPEDMSRATT